MKEVDVILYLVEPWLKKADKHEIFPSDSLILEKLQRVETPVILVVNKIDMVEKSELLTVIDVYQKLYSFTDIIPISALKADNTDDLLGLIKKQLPVGPCYFPENMVTDQPEKQIVSELIREKTLRFLREEVPHGIAVEVTSMKKRQKQELIDVEVVIYCERDSHKGILIGKSGSMLKKIGATARRDIEHLLGNPINLQLWVRVKKDWRDSDFYLKSFGYNVKQI
jgi:GTP-binding protein Era